MSRNARMQTLVAVIALLAASSNAMADVERGFHLSLGSSGHHLALQSNSKAALAEAGIVLGTNGVGGEVIAGYRFGPSLSLDLRFAGSGLDSGANRVDAGYASAAIQLVGYLRPGEKIQPYIVGGVGGAGVLLDGGAFHEQSIEGSMVNLGGGLDVHVSRRWVLGFDYRASLIDFDDTTLERTGARDVAFSGTGTAHEIGFRWGLRF